MTYVLKSFKGLFRDLEQAVRVTWKWYTAKDFPTEKAAQDFKDLHPELKDFAIVPKRGEK